MRRRSEKVHSLRPEPSAAKPGRSLPYASMFWPSRVTSLYPASPSERTSFLIASASLLYSLPLVVGTTQYVQHSLQP